MPDFTARAAPAVANVEPVAADDRAARREARRARKGGKAGKAGKRANSRVDAAPSVSAAEQIYAGKAAAPWTLIKRDLLRAQDDDVASPLAKDADALVRDLRAMRRDPGAGDYTELESRQQRLAKSIRATTYADSPQIKSALEKIDGILAEYHTKSGN